MTATMPATCSGHGPSDAALVVAARAGEQWAKEALFRRYARLVNGLAFRLLGRDDELEDLVQDSFVAALDGLARLREPQAFASFLASATVRTVHQRLKRRRMLARLRLRQQEPIDLEALVSTAAPADAVVELKAIFSLVDDLAVSDRVALILRRVEGYKVSEIAQLTKTSTATVKRRLARADHLLEARIGKNGQGEVL